MKTPLPGILLVALVAAGTCTGCVSTREPQPRSRNAGEATAERSHRAMLLEKLAVRKVASLPACLDRVPHPRFVLQFEGLVDLASAAPAASGMAEQDAVEVALVDAMVPDEVEVVGREHLKPHEPVLYFRKELNRNLGERTVKAGIRQLPLANTRVVLRESTLKTVWMHREEVSPGQLGAGNRCSLSWMPLADALAPESRLRSGVFGDGARDPDFVTSLFHLEEGEVFTIDFFTRGDGTPCIVRFLRGFERAMARSFGIAVPVDAETKTLTLHATTPKGTEEWAFTLPGEETEALLHVTNLPVSAGGDRDFAAHFSLRQGFEAAGAVVPLPSHLDCEDRGLDDDNPQCGPDDNKRP